jgi:ABC-type proline/glycine betaine transport system substrate-binding protein
MKKLLAIVAIVLMASVSFADEKADLAKDIQIGQLTLQNMGMQMQLLQEQFPKKKADVEAMMKKYQELEVREAKKEIPKNKK